MMSNKLYLLLLLGVAGSLLQVAAEDGEVTKDADDEAGDAAVDDEEEEEDDEDEEVDLADLEGEGGGDEGIATVSVFTENKTLRAKRKREVEAEVTAPVVTLSQKENRVRITVSN